MKHQNSQIQASIEREHTNAARATYGRLISTSSLTRMDSILEQVLNARQLAESVIFGIKIRKQELEFTRQRIKETNEFLTALMEGRQSLTPAQERIAEFISDVWIGEDFGFGELMAPYASIYRLYLYLQFGDPFKERQIPDILAAKYYRPEVDKNYEAEREERFKEEALTWLRDCRQRKIPKWHDARVIGASRKSADEDIAYFKGVTLYPREGLSDIYYLDKDDLNKTFPDRWGRTEPYPRSMKSLPKRVIHESEIKTLKEICCNELLALKNVGKRDVFKVTAEILELCQLLTEPDNHVNVASGVYREVAVNVSTTQEMINQAIQNLTELPRYTAMAKVIAEGEDGEEVRKARIKTAAVPAPRFSSNLERKIAYFSNDKVGTKRDVVVREIRERCAVWTKPVRSAGKPPEDEPPSRWE